MSEIFNKGLLESTRSKFMRDEEFDYVLVFTNVFDTTKDKRIPADEAKSNYRNVFKPCVIPSEMLDEETSKLFKIIEAQMEDFFDKNTEDGEVSLMELGVEILENVFMVLQDYLKFKFDSFFSRDRSEIFVRLSATEQNLQVQAHLIEYSLQFRRNQEYPERFAEVPPYADFIKPKKKEGMIKLVSASIDTHTLFKTYNSDDTETDDLKGSFFQYKDRVRLIHSIIDTSIDMSSLTKIGILLKKFPVHRNKQLDVLKTNWASFTKIFRKQDLELIREYYGEKIGFYFALLDYYLYWLILPSILGVISYILFMINGSNISDDEKSMTVGELTVLIFSMFLCFYATLFDQLWIRNEYYLSWKWGMWNQTLEEPQRPDFKGEIGIDEVTGRVKKLPAKETQNFFKRLASITLVTTFVGLVIAAIIAIFMYRATVRNTSWGPAACGIVNAVQIKVFNMIYSKLARYLNDWENYETDSEYFDSLSIKLYLFQFVNSYASLFYIAFMKGDLEGCEDDDCMSELSTQLTYIFLTNVAFNALELGWPYLSSKIKTYSEQRRMERLQAQGEQVRLHMNAAEQQDDLFQYETPLSDFMEIVIQYGYVVMFCSAFALSPMIALIITALEVRIDAWKLCYLTQRPFPGVADSIGVWYNILVTVSYFGAVTNAAIVVFTADVFDLDTKTEKWFIFLILEHVVLISKFLLSIIIPDKPKLIQDALVWNDRIVNEKLYLRYANKSKERQAWSLFYKAPQEQETIRFNQKAIEANSNI